MASTGLLVLDVDGPLNPYAAKPHRRPSGYQTFRHTAGGAWLSGQKARRGKGLRVWLNPGHGALLRALAQETGLDLVWGTTWLHEANTCIAPAIGLPTLPVIEFPAADLERGSSGFNRWRRDGEWKWPGVAAYAAGRPLAWLDDEHENPLFAGARTVFDLQRTGIPTLLCHVDPSTGVLPSHLERIRAWSTAGE